MLINGRTLAVVSQGHVILEFQLLWPELLMLVIRKKMQENVIASSVIYGIRITG